MTPFTPGELEVMQVLWDYGTMKPAEIQEKFPRIIGNAALRSMLLVLLEKNHVTRKKVGKAYFYTAKTARQGTFKQMVRELTNRFCGGSSTALIAQLIKMEKLNAEDIRELQRIAEDDEREGKN